MREYRAGVPASGASSGPKGVPAWCPGGEPAACPYRENDLDLGRAEEADIDVSPGHRQDSERGSRKTDAFLLCVVAEPSTIGV